MMYSDAGLGKLTSMELKIFDLGSNSNLAQCIVQNLGTRLGKVQISRFPDGEIFVEFQENVRGCDCFIIQSMRPHASDQILTIALAADTLKRASAGRVTAVLPYMAYMRQDRKLKPRVPISFKLVANILTASGVDRILTMDLHKGQLAGFFDIPVDNLLPHPVVIPLLKTIVKEQPFVVVSPDTGGVERARVVLDALDLPGELAVVYKQRDRSGLVSSMGIVGSPQGKIAIIIDDIVDTCSTLVQASKLLAESGATAVYAFATHGVLSDIALENLKVWTPTKLMVTNTIQIPEPFLNFVEIIDVSRLFSEAIRRIHTNESVSELFKW